MDLGPSRLKSDLRAVNEPRSCRKWLLKCSKCQPRTSKLKFVSVAKKNWNTTTTCVFFLHKMQACIEYIYIQVGQGNEQASYLPYVGHLYAKHGPRLRYVQSNKLGTCSPRCQVVSVVLTENWLHSQLQFVSTITIEPALAHCCHAVYTLYLTCRQIENKLKNVFHTLNWKQRLFNRE